MDTTTESRNHWTARLIASLRDVNPADWGADETKVDHVTTPMPVLMDSLDEYREAVMRRVHAKLARTKGK